MAYNNELLEPRDPSAAYQDDQGMNNSVLPDAVLPNVEQKLLLDCVFGPEENALRRFEDWVAVTDLKDKTDWGVFRLLPLVYDRLRELDVDHPLMGRLKGVYRRSFCENQGHLRLAAEIINLLKTIELRPMLLKGAPFCLDYYRTVAVRPMRDIDMVIQPKDFPDAIRLLKSEGWEPDWPGWTGDWSPIKGDYEFCHSITLRNRDGLELDLHWKCLAETSSDFFWRNAEPVNVLGAEAFKQAPTPLIVHTIIHGMRSNVEPPVRWIADSLVLLQKRKADVDWAAIVAFAKEKRITYRLGLGLRYLKSEFGADVPETYLAALEAVPMAFCEKVENARYLENAERFLDRAVTRKWRYFLEFAMVTRDAGPLSIVTALPRFVLYVARVERKRDFPGALYRRIFRGRQPGLSNTEDVPQNVGVGMFFESRAWFDHELRRNYNSQTEMR